MRLIENWKPVLFRSWAVWAGVLAAILGGAATSLYFYTASQAYPSTGLIILNGALTAAAGIAGALVPLLRVTRQKNISGDPDADQ
ncbi:hypothetical protein [Mesorhizobium sp. B2-4-6]|uniref:hypothetical protein n=1 Tax=Mesorhizobium sp. B2-4-6 TaxID=2589943 RepID=UPI001127BAAA|nr:hypothetical protein [Mesorhizobium sp. B2-4-6]TPL40710.1 hypothetical protein FJ957_26120 [Mesorhizobium sp. B2-4-6]